MKRKYSLKVHEVRVKQWKAVSPEDRLAHSKMMIAALHKKVLERKKNKRIEDNRYWKMLDGD